jgi:predicted integral membrane protein DUF2269
MYEWTKLIHVASAFGFILAHGASAAVALQLRRERDPGRVSALLDLSRGAMGTATWIAALVMLLSGIWLGFQADWWGRVWIWVSIGILVLIMGLMTPLGGTKLNRIRAALGMSLDPKKPAPAAVSRTELEAILETWDPVPLTAIGLGGLLLIVALMVLKPF